MKDNLSLIAAAAGGFMLSIAASGIIKAAPVISLSAPSNPPSQVTNLQASTSTASTASFAGGKSTPQTRSLRPQTRKNG